MILTSRGSRVILVPKPMKRRNVESALRAAGCGIAESNSGRNPHDKWECPCGKHTANVPRHIEISAGVIGDCIRRMECLPKGWLQ